MDDATSAIYSAFCADAFQGVSDPGQGPFCSLYATGTRPRPAARWFGRALAQLGIASPEARGRSERMFGTLLPQELRLAGITDMVEANRFLKEVFLPQPTPADPGRGPGHRLPARSVRSSSFVVSRGNSANAKF